MQCNASYNILTKIIANRLNDFLPKILSENQGGFIAERHITSNIIIAQEVMHSSCGRKVKGMAIKLDSENALNKVRHNFLFRVMKSFGFLDEFIKWIHASISSPWVTPLINGRPTKFFRI